LCELQKYGQSRVRSANLSGSGTLIAAYRFTSRAALVGDGGSVAAAAPGSILVAGIVAAESDDHDHLLGSPLPRCVWLTSDPEMPDDFCTRHGVRISVVIPSTDPRLVHWPKYARKHGAGLAIESARIPAAAWRTASQFWLYFDPIAPGRFRAVGSVAPRTPAMVA
jgi:hypothetical protein